MSRERIGYSVFSKILVPLDGSKTAEKALPYARHLARQNEAQIHLVYVCADVMWAAGDGSLAVLGVGYYPIQQEVAESERHFREDYLANLQKELQSEGLEAVYHCFQGDAAAEILELSEREAFDLIVLTSHGRTGVSHFFLGSVAEWLARKSPCPVLIVGHHSIEVDEDRDKTKVLSAAPLSVR